MKFIDEATIEVVKIPDERLDKLTELFNPKKKINATIEVFDTPGLKMSDDGKVKITSQFLNNVKNNDALFYVIRQFQDYDSRECAYRRARVRPIRVVRYLPEQLLPS